MGVASSYVPHGVAPQRPVMLADGKERRRRRRVELMPGYTSVIVRVLGTKAPPLDGHVVDVSEMGLAVELDEKVKPGSAVAVEFTIAGMGRMRNQEWPTFVSAAEVLRHDNVDDFPGGPYKTALRFIRLPSIVQAQIARYVIAQPAGASA